MMNPIVYALEAAADTPFKDTVGATLGERAGVAGSVSLLGMVAVFAVLALLWGVIELLHRALTRTGSEAPQPAHKEQEKVAPVKPVREVKKNTPQAADTAVTAANDDALIAVITAAVAAAMADEGYTGGFRVVSFQRMPTRRGGRM